MLLPTFIVVLVADAVGLSWNSCSCTLNNICRVFQGLHGNSTEGFFLKNLYCLKCAAAAWSGYSLCSCCWHKKKQWNESGFRPLLCTYRLNLARRTSWGWWDEWDDTALQTQDSKFKLWRSEAEYAISRIRRLPTILSFRSRWRRNIFVSFKLPSPGDEPRSQAWKAAVLTATIGPPPSCCWQWLLQLQQTRDIDPMLY